MKKSKSASILTSNSFHMMGKKNNIKVGLLGASFNTNNMGVNALTIGTIKSILASYKNANIYLLDYGNTKMHYNLQLSGKNVRIQLINMRFSKKFYLKNNIALLLLLSLIIKIIPFQVLRHKFISKNYYLKKISEFDIVASIAGGDSFSDIYGLRRFLYVTLPQILVLFMRKKLILLPQTYGPYKRRIVRIIARYVFNHSYILYSRDYSGLSVVKRFLNKHENLDKLRFCYDVGFVLDPEKPQIMDLCGIHIHDKNDIITGINISGLLYMGGYTRDNMFGLRVNYKGLVHEIIDFMVRKKDTVILLIPHVFGSSEKSESDSLVCEKLYNELKDMYRENLFLVKGKYNQNEIKYIIGLCDFFIGSRMHSCIAALSQCIPTIAIAYSKKFLGVMETLETPQIVADVRKIDKENVISLINNVFNSRERIKKSLEDKIPIVKKTILNLFSERNIVFE